MNIIRILLDEYYYSTPYDRELWKYLCKNEITPWFIRINLNMNTVENVFYNIWIDLVLFQYIYYLCTVSAVEIKDLKGQWVRLQEEVKV